MNSFKGSNSTQGSEPWGPQGDQLKKLYSENEELYNSRKGQSWYDGATLAGPTDYQRQSNFALKQTGADLAQQGSDTVGNSQKLFADAMQRGLFGDVSVGPDTFQSYGAPSSISYSADDQPDLMGYRAAGYRGQGAAPNPSAGMTGFVDPGSNPYFLNGLSGAITDTTNKFNRSTLPGIKSAAISQGAYGGARQDISEGVARAESEKNLSDIVANAFLQQYGQERQLGTQQENLAAQLESQNWGTGEQLNTSRYNTTEGLRANDLASRNSLNTNWAINKDNNSLQSILAANKNALDWASTQDTLSTQRLMELNKEAAARNMGRDQLNQQWDLSKLSMVPGLMQQGQNSMVTGQTLGNQAGAQEQQWSQAQLDDEMNRWMNEQNYATNNLTNYASVIQGYGAPTQQIAKNNPLTSIFGGGMGGAVAGNALGNLTGLFSGQNGGMYGGLLGALLGAF